MRRHIVKVDNKWQLVSTECRQGIQLLVLPMKTHVTKARTVAITLGLKVKHSTYQVCDYFGGSSKTYGYSHWDRYWVVE